MKSTIRKILSTVLAVAMVGAMSANVMASEVENGDYVVTYSAAEITDVDELIDLAIKQMSQEPLALSTMPCESETLSATQLLEVRKYADGHEEKAFSNSAIKLTDENGKGVRTDVSGNQHTSGASGYSIAMSTTAYYTARINVPVNPPALRLDYAVCTISHSGGPVLPSSVEFYGAYTSNIYETKYCSTSSYQSITFVPNNTSFYTTTTALMFQTTLFLSNGSYLVTHNMIS